MSENDDFATPDSKSRIDGGGCTNSNVLSKAGIETTLKSNRDEDVDSHGGLDSYWSIGVKTVSSNLMDDFTVFVSPEDDLDQLYHQIERRTGLTAAQQRLIYRGRLIENNITTDIAQHSRDKYCSPGRGVQSPGLNTSNAATPLLSPSSSSHDTTITTNDQTTQHAGGASSLLPCNKHAVAASESSPTSNKKTKPRIKDIAGLNDGHTIHLVERKIQSSPSHASNGDYNTSGIGSAHISSTADDGETGNVNNAGNSSSPGATSLLAALLGMGSSNNNNSNNEPSPGAPWNSNNTNDEGDNDDETTDSTRILNSVLPPRARWRPRYTPGTVASPSSLSRSRRNMSYRLTEEDFRVPDPGSMESVRQGLMTLHTLLSSCTCVQPQEPQPTDHNDDATKNECNSIAVVSHTGEMTLRSQSAAQPQEGQQHSPVYAIQYHQSPLDTPRRFYRGQWIDVRDTVHQWLEATIVEVVLPNELLPHPSSSPPKQHSIKKQSKKKKNVKKVPPTLVATSDPAISAADTDGRRRLLLEKCTEEEHDPSIGIEIDAQGDPVYYRQRESNANVQLLLIHYNGWPHRWDEWIRSDSERIRPFRTRTRHTNSSSGGSMQSQRISPTVHSLFSEAPPTYLYQQPQNYQQDQQNQSHRNHRHLQIQREQDRLALMPELERVLTVVAMLLSDVNNSNNISPGISAEASAIRDSNYAHLPWNPMHANAAGTTDSIDSPSTIPEEIDEEAGDSENGEEAKACRSECGEDGEEERKPRSSTSSNMRTVNDDTDRHGETPSRRRRRRKRELEVLASLFDRLGRTLVDSAPHVAALAASLTDIHSSTSSSQILESSSSEHSSIEHQQRQRRPQLRIGGRGGALTSAEGGVTSASNNRNHNQQQQPSTLSGFLSLLSRGDRSRTTTTSVGSSNAATVVGGNDNSSVASVANNSVEQHVTVISASNSTTPQFDDVGVITDNDQQDEESTTSTTGDDGSESVIYFDPDYTDFATGLINTTRGDIRGGGPRNTSTSAITRQSLSGASSASDELAGLLGAYLAAASLGGVVSATAASNDDEDANNADDGEDPSPTDTTTAAHGLGRILRERGIMTAGNGIDIHIHAVVTAPGGGNVGLATLGGGTTTTLFSSLGTPAPTTSRNSNTSRRHDSETSPSSLPNHLLYHLQEQVDDEDELGIFAELYSETPEPIDPTAFTANATTIEATPSSSSLTARGNTPSPTSSLFRAAPPAVDTPQWQLPTILNTRASTESERLSVDEDEISSPTYSTGTTGFRNHRNSISGESSLTENAHILPGSNNSSSVAAVASPLLFSRNSRRSGFVSSGIHSTSATSVMMTTANNGISDTLEVATLVDVGDGPVRTVSAVSAATSSSGGGGSLSSSNTTSSFSSNIRQQQQQRGSILTRLFRRNGNNAIE